MGPVLDAAADGLCLNPKQLQGVANTLQTALQLRSVVCQAADLGSSQSDAPVMKYPALVPLTAGIEAEEEQTLRALQLCIQVRIASHACQGVHAPCQHLRVCTFRFASPGVRVQEP